jgi:hypothetical protein
VKHAESKSSFLEERERQKTVAHRGTFVVC